jgi:hypothetical protein
MGAAVLMSLVVGALAAAVGWHALASACGAEWLVSWLGGAS